MESTRQPIAARLFIELFENAYATEIESMGVHIDLAETDGQVIIAGFSVDLP